MALGSNVDENKPVDEVCDTQGDDSNVATGEDSAAESSDHTDSSGLRRRSFKAKPRIPTAVDTSRLNKHLTSIWSSKRKKPMKKSAADSLQAHRSDLLMENEAELCDHVGATADESLPLSTQASTVIIVKTMPQPDGNSYDLPPVVSRMPEGIDKAELQKGSRDIAERLKAKKQRFAATLGGSGVDASLNDRGQVTCELCAETVGDYVELVRHVCQRHEDCTYVRSYLDEIQPIADALTAVSVPCDACGRTFAGQAALAAHRHECSAVSKDGHVSKLGAKRRRLTASLLSPSEHANDHSQQNAATKPARRSAPVRGGVQKCDHCKRTFSSQEQLAKHVARVHSEKDQKHATAAARGRRARSAAGVGKMKSTAASDSKFERSANHASESSSLAGVQYQRCDHCTASFSRTSLLVTHMRYCLKADSNR